MAGIANMLSKKVSNVPSKDASVETPNVDAAPKKESLNKKALMDKLGAFYKGDFEALRYRLEMDPLWVPQSLKGAANNTKRNKFNKLKDAILMVSNSQSLDGFKYNVKNLKEPNPYLSKLSNRLDKQNWQKESGITTLPGQIAAGIVPSAVEGWDSEASGVLGNAANVGGAVLSGIGDVLAIPAHVGMAAVNSLMPGHGGVDEFLEDVSSPYKYRTGPERMADDLFSGYGGGAAIKGIGKVITSPKIAKSVEAIDQLYRKSGELSKFNKATAAASKGARKFSDLGTRVLRPDMAKSVGSQVRAVGSKAPASLKRRFAEGAADAALPSFMEARDSEHPIPMFVGGALLGGGVNAGLSKVFPKTRKVVADEIFPEGTSALASKVKKDDLAEAMRFHNDFPNDADAAEKSIAGIGRVMDESLDIAGKDFRESAVQGLDDLASKADPTELVAVKNNFVDSFQKNIDAIESGIPFSESSNASFLKESARSIELLKRTDAKNFHNTLVKEATRLGKLTGKGGDEYKELYKVFKGTLNNDYPDILSSTVKANGVGDDMGNIVSGKLKDSYGEFSDVFDKFKPFNELGVRGKQFKDLDLKGAKKVGSFANEAGQSATNPLAKSTVTKHIELVDIVEDARQKVISNLKGKISNAVEGSKNKMNLTKKLTDMESIDTDYLTEAVKAKVANSSAGSTKVNEWNKERVANAVREFLSGSVEKMVRGEGALNKGSVNIPAGLLKGSKGDDAEDIKETDASSKVVSQYKDGETVYKNLPGNPKGNVAWLNKPANRAAIFNEVVNSGEIKPNTTARQISNKIASAVFANKNN